MHKEKKSSHSFHSWLNYNVFLVAGNLDGELALIGEQKCVASLSQLKELLCDTCRKDQCCWKISRIEASVIGNFYLQYLNSIFNSKKLNAYVFYWFYYVPLKIYVEDGFFAFFFYLGLLSRTFTNYKTAGEG